MAGMPRIIASEDLDNASSNERLNCVHAVSAAKEIARISVEEPSYRDGLRYCLSDLISSGFWNIISNHIFTKRRLVSTVGFLL